MKVKVKCKVLHLDQGNHQYQERAEDESLKEDLGYCWMKNWV